MRRSLAIAFAWSSRSPAAAAPITSGSTPSGCSTRRPGTRSRARTSRSRRACGSSGSIGSHSRSGWVRGAVRERGGERIPSFDWRHRERARLPRRRPPGLDRRQRLPERLWQRLRGRDGAVAAANERVGRAAPGPASADWLGPARVVGETAPAARTASGSRPAARGRGDRRPGAAVPGARASGAARGLRQGNGLRRLRRRVLHELEVDAALGIPAADRPALGGATGACSTRTS